MALVGETTGDPIISTEGAPTRSSSVGWTPDIQNVRGAEDPVSLEARQPLTMCPLGECASNRPVILECIYAQVPSHLK